MTRRLTFLAAVVGCLAILLGCSIGFDGVVADKVPRSGGVPSTTAPAETGEDTADGAGPGGAAEGQPEDGAAVDGAGSPAQEEQWRGYWVDSFNEGIATPDEVRQMVADAQAVGANALVVQVARWYDCFCDDSSLPRTDADLDPGYDPLEEVVAQAHAAGIEVHAWVNATTMWSRSTPPAAPDHVYNTHAFSATGSDRWLNKRNDGVEKLGTMSYVDPANPAAVDYLVDGVVSIAQNYDIDGVNLDYIRYPDDSANSNANDWGYSETSLARFAAETGRSDVPAPSDPQFSDWRRQQVTNVVRKVYVGLYQNDPTDRLSVNAVTYGDGPITVGAFESTQPYLGVLQDWKGWLQDGIVDTVMTMNYKSHSSATSLRRFDEWNAALLEYAAGRHVVAGPGLYLNDIGESVAQTQRIADLGLGWNGYSYANVSDTAADSSDVAVDRAERAALTSALRSGVFANDVTVPRMTWKTDPSTGVASGTVDLRGGGPVDVVVRPADGSGEQKAVRTDASGWFAATGLEPDRYEVQAPGTDPSTVRVKAGEVAQAELSPADG
ncbi:family 10 glycosylhydrolase [Cellulomonas chengniuliangii]|uniref:family 10 glycosylhydrolase n=1 Tax=Cellulomonas chengniuliangii TaxID=2968084 RepID=UPI001D0EC88A|nr:family 10 glycosylhydrolase [Cellulomonas chengniuliangii]MCC2317123.1 family 10 glycosylhydrolase [Cellulomonas chengniuliangii]